MSLAKLPEYISVQTAAKRLEVSERFIDDAIRAGDLRCEYLKKMKRIPVAEYVAWVDSLRASR